MPEWSIGPHSKCGERATVPRVRIPVFPLHFLQARITRITRSLFDRNCPRNLCLIFNLYTRRYEGKEDTLYLPRKHLSLVYG